MGIYVSDSELPWILGHTSELDLLMFCSMYAFHISVSFLGEVHALFPVKEPPFCLSSTWNRLEDCGFIYCWFPSFNKKLSAPTTPGNEQLGGVITERDTLPISLGIRAANTSRTRILTSTTFSGAFSSL